TLGKISFNYAWQGEEIIRTADPYNAITNGNLDHWDAFHYNNIRTNGYDFQKNKDASPAVFAFFPLFPYAWKISGLDFRGIVILNYFLFVIAAWLASMLFPENKSRGWPVSLLVFIALLVLPSAISFRIPYPEAFFAFTFFIALLGAQRKNYIMYFF